jgi:hypothetical protein
MSGSRDPYSTRSLLLFYAECAVGMAVLILLAVTIAHLT